MSLSANDLAYIEASGAPGTEGLSGGKFTYSSRRFGFKGGRMRSRSRSRRRRGGMFGFNKAHFKKVRSSQSRHGRIKKRFPSVKRGTPQYRRANRIMRFKDKHGDRYFKRHPQTKKAGPWYSVQPHLRRFR